VQGQSGVQQVTSGSRVGAGTYVTGGSGVGVTSTYQTGYVQPATTYTTTQQPVTYTTSQQPVTYTTQVVGQPSYVNQGYTSTTTYPGNYETTYQTGSYVPSGSGVRGASGAYVTGGSGVRGNTTYVSTGGSKVNQTSY
jgi:hypothetical protein